MPVLDWTVPHFFYALILDLIVNKKKNMFSFDDASSFLLFLVKCLDKKQASIV